MQTMVSQCIRHFFLPNILSVVIKERAIIVHTTARGYLSKKYQYSVGHPSMLLYSVVFTYYRTVGNEGICLNTQVQCLENYPWI